MRECFIWLNEEKEQVNQPIASEYVNVTPGSPKKNGGES